MRLIHATQSVFPLLPLLLLAVFLAIPAFAATPNPTVTYSVIEEQPEYLPRRYMGRVETPNFVDIRVRTEGFIQKIHFTEGQMVKQGDLLFEIDPAMYEANVEQAAAQVKGAEATMELANLMNTRLQSLAQTNAVSRADADRAFADLAVARAGVLQAQASLDARKLELGYTKIVAPISGRIGLTTVSAGSFVNVATPAVVNIVQLDPIRVVIGVRESDFISAASGKPASEFRFTKDNFRPVLRLANGEQFPETGVFASLGNQISPQTGTVEVRALFANPNRVLLPGGVVDVSFSAQNPPMRPVVPVAALQQDRSGFFVLVIEGKNTVSIRKVTLGAQTGEAFIVQEGLKAGEKVVVEGLHRVRPGSTVNPIAATPLMQ